MGDIELQIFADKLKELRLSLGLTQAEFVEKLGITASALSAYEKNQKNPSISIVKKIAEQYNVSIDWLCGLTNKKHVNNIISTVSDIVKLLLQIEKNTCIEDIVCYISDNLPFFCEYNAIVFADEHICDFLKEWHEIKKLHDNNTIDDELYSLWVEKTLNKYKQYSIIEEETQKKQA